MRETIVQEFLNIIKMNVDCGFWWAADENFKRTQFGEVTDNTEYWGDEHCLHLCWLISRWKDPQQFNVTRSSLAHHLLIWPTAKSTCYRIGYGWVDLWYCIVIDLHGGGRFSTELDRTVAVSCLKFEVQILALFYIFQPLIDPSSIQWQPICWKQQN